MKRRIHLIFITMVMVHHSLFLNAMDQTITAELEKKSLVYRTSVLAHIETCSQCKEVINFHAGIAELVLNAGDLVNDQEKLNHIDGDAFYPQRKVIIKKMIQQGTHPDKIVYCAYKNTPMKEALAYKDREFMSHLIERGAKAPI